MPERLEWWDGRLDARTRPSASTTLRVPIERAKSSGAGAFLGIGADRRRYWVKVPGNHQGEQALINEVIVAELGRLIGAPVRERTLLTVPPELTSEWSLFPAPRSAAPLLAHGSLHVPDAEDSDRLKYTSLDGNAKRQAALLGLWDLCLGDDPQWLYQVTESSTIWSYDHGLWFLNGEGDWNRSVLQKMVELDGTTGFPDVPGNIDIHELAEVAARIEALDCERLLTVVADVPVEWGTANSDLEAMAWFLFRRRGPVAQRLRRIADSFGNLEDS